jgi:hypothetical protein
MTKLDIKTNFASLFQVLQLQLQLNFFVFLFQLNTYSLFNNRDRNIN